MLLAGKDAPDDFAQSIILQDYKVAVAKSDESNAEKTEKIVSLKWNKASPVSARSMILGTENAFGAIDVVVLYFDASSFASQFVSCTVENISTALDSLVAGFQYLAVETMARFEQKKLGGRLVFLLKPYSSFFETIRSSQQRNSTVMPLGPIVSAAQAAFGAFAENFAAISQERQYGTVILGNVSTQNEIGVRDKSLANWLANYLVSLDGKEKNTKQPLSWIKVGVKNSGFLGLFR